MRRLLLLPLLALSLLVAGCGGDGGPAPEAAVAEAAGKTTDAGSGRIAITADTEVPKRGTLSFNGEGVFDYRERRGHMSLDLSALAGAANPDAARADFVFDDLVMYMRFPALARELGTKKPWLKIDLEAAGKQQGVDLSQFTQFNQDPTQAIQYLRAASKGIEEVGTEDVRGVETTHYRATIDLRKVPDVVPEEQRDALRQSVDAIIERTGQSEIPTDVWIDEEGRVRKQRYTQRIPAGTDELEQTITMELYDFGTEVTVEIPPANQVTDLLDIASETS